MTASKKAATAGRPARSGSRSLWLFPQQEPLIVSIHRWANYPYFLETLEHFGDPISQVTVTWGPFSDFTKYLIDVNSEEEAEEVQGFIDSRERAILRGDDVPPLVRWHNGEHMDGRHRAWGARKAGLKIAPAIELGYESGYEGPRRRRPLTHS